MSEAQENSAGKKTVSTLRILEAYSSTAEDLARAESLAAHDCPRRYCWWWHSLSFDWQLDPSQGCTFLSAPKPPGWTHNGMSCCRRDPSSTVDHFEPREPHLLEDGFDGSKWLPPVAENSTRSTVK